MIIISLVVVAVVVIIILLILLPAVSIFFSPYVLYSLKKLL